MVIAPWGKLSGPAARSRNPRGLLTPACMVLGLQITKKGSVGAQGTEEFPPWLAPHLPAQRTAEEQLHLKLRGVDHRQGQKLKRGAGLFWNTVLTSASFLSTSLTSSYQIRTKCFSSCWTHLGSSHPEDQLLNVAFSRALVWNGSNHKHEVIPAATKGQH